MLSPIYRRILSFFKHRKDFDDVKQHINKIAPAKALDKKSLKKSVNKIQRSLPHYKKEREKLLKNIELNIDQLHPIAENLFDKNLKTYYEKVIDLIEQSRSFSRILKRLDVAKPYAPKIVAVVSQQTTAINKLIIKLYSF